MATRTKKLQIPKIELKFAREKKFFAKGKAVKIEDLDLIYNLNNFKQMQNKMIQKIDMAMIYQLMY